MNNKTLIMNILDFATDIGRKVFDTDELAAEEISEGLSIQAHPDQKFIC